MKSVIGHLLIAGICGLGIMQTGCQAIGAVAYVFGPPPIKPQYVPAQTPMLVLADSATVPGSASLQAEQLERHVIFELTKHEIAPMANNEKVYELRVAEPEKFRTMSIAALGRLADASQVLYISMQLEAADLGIGGADVLKGQGSAYVRIVDVASGHTLWPTNESRGYPVQHKSRYTYGASAQDNVQRKIQTGLADQIVKLFYRYQPEEFEDAD